MLDLNNWNYCHYSTGPLKSMIAQGQDPHGMELLYCLTVLKDETQEVYQAQFQHLPKALKTINDRYRHWDFTDTSEAQEGGCGSCSNKK